MKYNIMLKALSTPFKAYAPGKAPVKCPAGFSTYYGADRVPPQILRHLARSYRRVFAEPPWNEEWKVEEVEEKIIRELEYPSCLAVMEGNNEWRVGGFSWGAVVPAAEAARRTQEAHKLDDHKAQEVLRRRLEATFRGDKVYFLDEVAILRDFRGGMSPIQFLVRPSLEVAVDEGAVEGIGWTSWDSKIAPLSLYLGFSTLVAEVKGLAFLYNPDIRPLLKIAQNVNGQVLERLVRSATRLARKVA
ncbi:MAG: hypothetical protein SWK76_03800 [Actinomycetota bacterium]|nr:hypothetical protein [Actinomycetota bacterium]